MLTDEKKGIVRLLVALAWADGKVDEQEKEIVEAVLDAFGATIEESEEIRTWAASPRTLDDVDVSSLEKSDLELALQHGVLLTHIDGEQTDEELKLLSGFVEKLGLTVEEAKPVIESANVFAKALLPELEA